jgi:hypothetical protein
MCECNQVGKFINNDFSSSSPLQIIPPSVNSTYDLLLTQQRKHTLEKNLANVMTVGRFLKNA